MIHLLLATALSGGPAPGPATQVTSREIERPRSATTDSQVQLGLEEYRRRRFQAAERHFQAAVDADPQSAEAVFYLAYTVYKIAEPKRPDDPGKHRAAELFARAYSLDPTFVPSWR
jgi:Tfp pilus assembly protein PilF